MRRSSLIALLVLAACAALPMAGRADPDDLYRRRGYGIGGSAFGLRHGGTAMAGACAELHFAKPRSCSKGYGIYGNGLGYGFGF